MTSPPVLLSASFQHELESKITIFLPNIAIVYCTVIIFCALGREEWDPETTLYQPYEVEQIIMPDNAQCLAVQVFLKMLQLPFRIQYRMNAEHMSPTGKS